MDFEPANSRSSVGTSKLSIRSEDVRKEMDAITTITGRVRDFGKLCGLISPVILALIVLATLSLIQVVSKYDHLISLEASLNENEKFQTLVEVLEDEKDNSCEFMHDIGYNGEDLREIKDTMKEQRIRTNLAMKNLMKFPKVVARLELEMFILRQKIDTKMIEHCDQVVSLYNMVIEELFAEIIHQFDIGGEESHFWVVEQTYDKVLKLKEMVSVQQGLGAEFFSAENFKPEVKRDFVGSEYAIKYMTRVVRETVDFIDRDFKAMYDKDTILYTNLEVLYQQIATYDQQTFTHQSDVIKSVAWFDDMNIHLSHLKVIEDDISDFLLKSSGTTASNKRFQFVTDLIIVAVIFLICPLTFYIYTLNGYKMKQKLISFAVRIKKNQSQISREKKKTETLLNQLLPSQIAAKILSSERVEPEFYDSVTIFFSEVVGFNVSANRSSPDEITTFLNELYTHVEAVIAMFDCYKIETIVDQYVIVSGLPERNSNHSDVIVSMSLHLINSLAEFRIANKPIYKSHVMLTIGCHTGSAAAGVIGLQAPRYCVFGDSVNIAARMQSTGSPNRIQISNSCYQNLTECATNRFLTQHRTTVTIKGKGKMDTHWVIGRTDMDFQINVSPENELIIRK